MRRLSDQQLQEQVAQMIDTLPEVDRLYSTAPDLAGTIVSLLRDQGAIAGYDRTVDIVFSLQQASMDSRE